MKQENIKNAYYVLKRFSTMQFKVKDAFGIYKLLKELEPSINFAIEREQKMVEQYNGTINPDGTISFIHGDTDEDKRKGMENFIKFKKEMDEIAAMDIDLDFSPITLAYDSLGDQTISPNDLMSLEGFVSFE